jgi:branched-chain amino acid transport system permease protein
VPKLVKAIIVGVVVTGAIYSLQTVGFVLVIRGTGLFNFAQGQLMALGAYVFYDLITYWGSTRFGLVFVVMIGILGCAGALLYRVVLAGFEGAPMWAGVMALFGVSYILDAAIRIRWSVYSLYLSPPISITRLELPFGFAASSLDLALVGTAAITLGVVLIVVYFTPAGLQMRASAENRLLAAYAGVHVDRISMITWFLATALVAIAGLAIALRTQVDPSIASGFLVAFPAVVLGGMDSIVGGIVGSFLIVLVTSVSVTYFGGDIALPIAYAVLFAILLVRPSGLFGTPDIVRV